MSDIQIAVPYTLKSGEEVQLQLKVPKNSLQFDRDGNLTGVANEKYISEAADQVARSRYPNEFTGDSPAISVMKSQRMLPETYQQPTKKQEIPEQPSFWQKPDIGQIASAYWNTVNPINLAKMVAGDSMGWPGEQNFSPPLPQTSNELIGSALPFGISGIAGSRPVKAATTGAIQGVKSATPNVSRIAGLGAIGGGIGALSSLLKGSNPIHGFYAGSGVGMGLDSLLEYGNAAVQGAKQGLKNMPVPVADAVEYSPPQPRPDAVYPAPPEQLPPAQGFQMPGTSPVQPPPQQALGTTQPVGLLPAPSRVVTPPPPIQMPAVGQEPFTSGSYAGPTTMQGQAPAIPSLRTPRVSIPETWQPPAPTKQVKAPEVKTVKTEAPVTKPKQEVKPVPKQDKANITAKEPDKPQKSVLDVVKAESNETAERQMLHDLRQKDVMSLSKDEVNLVEKLEEKYGNEALKNLKPEGTAEQAYMGQPVSHDELYEQARALGVNPTQLARELASRGFEIQPSKFSSGWGIGRVKKSDPISPEQIKAVMERLSKKQKP